MPSLTEEQLMPPEADMLVPRVTSSHLLEDFTNVLAFGKIDRDDRHDPFSNRPASVGQSPYTYAQLNAHFKQGSRELRELKQGFLNNVLLQELKTELYIFHAAKTKKLGPGALILEVADVLNFQGKDTVNKCQVYLSFVPFSKIEHFSSVFSGEALSTFYSTKRQSLLPHSLLLHFCDYEYAVTVQLTHQNGDTFRTFDEVLDKEPSLLELCDVEVIVKDTWWDVSLLIYKPQTVVLGQ
jgi:hypothetical protein